MLFELCNSLLSLLGNFFDKTKMQHIEVRALKSENLRYPFRFMYRYTTVSILTEGEVEQIYVDLLLYMRCHCFQYR